LLDSHTNLVSVNDAVELTRHLSRHVPLLAPPHAHRRRGAFTPVLTVPKLVAADMQRHALGLDNSEELPKIAVGVVSYNNDPLQLDRCLRSARAANILLLWDNGVPSSPATDIVPSLIHKGAEGNLGFGAAHNRLMEQAFASGADLYVATSPDGFFRPDALARVARMIAARNGLALIECARFPVDHPKAFDELSLRTNWASGAAMAIPRLVFEAIGGFDESFFMHCEDVDLSWRARAHGFEVAICPNALFAHEVTNREMSDATLAMIAESGVLLARKWRSRPFARWAARQAKSPVEPRREVAPVPHEWSDVADFDHGFSFSETRWP
jgi:GT2 family glycosyltransferase